MMVVGGGEVGGGEERASSTLCGRRYGRKKERVGTEGREDNALQWQYLYGAWKFRYNCHLSIC